MNDFTKEELEDILKTYFCLNGDPTEIEYKIETKLKIMIDSYFEHETVVPNYDCKTQCDKCGVIL